MLARKAMLAAALIVCAGLSAGAALSQTWDELPTKGGGGPGDFGGAGPPLRDDRRARGFICVRAYEDANGNGARDRGDWPLPGWTYSVTDARGRLAARGMTDGGGGFCNGRPLAPGEYRITQMPIAGWINTDPGGAKPAVRRVVLPAEGSVTASFGNCRAGRCGAPGPHGLPGRDRPGR